MTRSLMAAVALVVVGTVAVGAKVSSQETDRIRASADVLSPDPQWWRTDKDIPQDLWQKAACVVVIPSLKKAAFGFGAEYGKGLMSCRRNSVCRARIHGAREGELGLSNRWRIDRPGPPRDERVGDGEDAPRQGVARRRCLGRRWPGRTECGGLHERAGERRDRFRARARKGSSRALMSRAACCARRRRQSDLPGREISARTVLSNGAKAPAVTRRFMTELRRERQVAQR